MLIIAQNKAAAAAWNFHVHKKPYKIYQRKEKM